MTWRLTVLLGEPPILVPTDPITGEAMPNAVLTEDTRIVVDVVEFAEKPDENPWLAPDNPPWGALDEKTGRRKKGGTYSFVMEEVV